MVRSTLSDNPIVGFIELAGSNIDSPVRAEMNSDLVWDSNDWEIESLLNRNANEAKNRFGPSMGFSLEAFVFHYSFEEIKSAVLKSTLRKQKVYKARKGEIY